MHHWAQAVIQDAHSIAASGYQTHEFAASPQQCPNDDPDDEDRMPDLMDADEHSFSSSSSSSSTSVRDATDVAPWSPHSSSASTVSYSHHRLQQPFFHDHTLHPMIRNHVLKYKVDLSQLQECRSLFHPLAPDEATLQFLRDSCDAYSQPFSFYYLMHALIKPLVATMLSHTNVNGLLGTGDMFLLSGDHFLSLWRASQQPIDSNQQSAVDQPSSMMQLAVDVNDFASSPIATSIDAKSSPASHAMFSSNQTINLGKLLDVGAGSGAITQNFALFFESVTATEVSWAMCRRLRHRQFTTYCTESLDAIPAAEKFDCILCFNVIDRCDQPVSLIRSLRSRLRDEHSRLIIATPLPFDAWVEDVNSRQWRRPSESFSLTTKADEHACCMSWEASAVALTAMLASIGLEVCTISRVPYYSQGNNHRPFFVLDDAIFVLKLRNATE